MYAITSIQPMQTARRPQMPPSTTLESLRHSCSFLALTITCSNIQANCDWGLLVTLRGCDISRYTVDEGEEPELPPVQLTLFIHKLTMSAEFTKKAQVRFPCRSALLLFNFLEPLTVLPSKLRVVGVVARTISILKYPVTSIGFTLPLDLRRCNSNLNRFLCCTLARAFNVC